MRIDCFVIKRIRKDIKSAIYNKSNNLISAPFMDRSKYYENCLPSGHIPPEGFKYLDENHYIINRESIPILYHTPRNNNNKSINYDPEKIHKVHLI